MTIRINEPSDAAGVSSLFRRVFIEEEGANSDGDCAEPAFLAWKYADRASGRPLSLAALGEDGEVIGHTGLVFQRRREEAGSRPGPAALNVDSAVLRPRRSLSVYLGLMKRAVEAAREAGASLVYTHANGNAEPVMKKALRFKELFRFSAWAYAPLLSMAAGPLAPGGRALPAREFPDGYEPVESDVALSREEYQARYFGAPTRAYRAWAFGDYLILGKLKRPAGVAAFLALAAFKRRGAEDEDGAGLAAALRAAARAERAPLVYLANDRVPSAALRRAGFLPATGIMERYLKAGVAVIGLPLDGGDPGGFRCSLGDIDS